MRAGESILRRVLPGALYREIKGCLWQTLLPKFGFIPKLAHRAREHLRETDENVECYTVSPSPTLVIVGALMLKRWVVQLTYLFNKFA